jgi:hypothetical protein
MVRLGEQEDNVSRLQRMGKLFGIATDLNAELLQNIGASAGACHRSVAVFCDANPCGTGNDRRRSGNIERLGATPRSARVNEVFMGMDQDLSFFSQDADKSGQLPSCAPLHPEAKKNRPNLSVGGLTAHEVVH